MPPSDLEFARVPITHPDAALLIAQVQLEYAGLYGTPDESPIEPAEFEGDRGAFFVASIAGTPVATGAWRFRRTPDGVQGHRSAEIKRMYVVPTARRRGISREVLHRLEESATEAGADAIILETGTLQPAAIALYVSEGYLPIPGFGSYAGDPLNACFAKRLS